LKTAVIVRLRCAVGSRSMRHRVGNISRLIQSCERCLVGNVMRWVISCCEKAAAVRDAWLRVRSIGPVLRSLKLLTMVTCDCVRLGLGDSIRCGFSFTKDSASEY